MTNKSIYIFFVVLFISCNQKDRNSTLDNEDSMCRKWHRVTMQSLDSHIESMNDTSQRAMYKNTRSIFESTVNSNGEEIDNTVFRCIFLKEVVNNKFFNKDIYIIEANTEGGTLLTRSFIIYPTKPGLADLYVYYYANGKWIQYQNSTQVNITLNVDLQKYYVGERGINYEDVIITHIADDKVMNSEYYLSSTLSKESGLEDILKN